MVGWQSLQIFRLQPRFLNLGLGNCRFICRLSLKLVFALHLPGKSSIPYSQFSVSPPLMTELYQVIIALTNFWVGGQSLQRVLCRPEHLTTLDNVLNIGHRLRKDWPRAVTGHQVRLTGPWPCIAHWAMRRRVGATYIVHIGLWGGGRGLHI